MTSRILAISLILLIGAGCTAIPKHRVNHEYIANPESRTPKKVVILPADITVSEISAGGVTEEVPAWSNSAKTNVNNALKKFKQVDLDLTALPKLEDTNQKIVDEHLALYDLVASNAAFLPRTPGGIWNHKATHFDYTLGNGLKFLREKTGADAALFVVGLDQISSAERQAAVVAAALFGVGIPLGVSFLSTGIIDLNSGDILWLNYAVSIGNKDLRKPEDAEAMVAELLENFPGIEAYKEIKVSQANIK